MNAVSTTSPASLEITLRSATSPEAQSIRGLERSPSAGPGAVLKMVARLVKEADMAAGGRCTDDEIELITRHAVNHFRHRSVESLVLAINTGAGRTDPEGKIFGKLTWNTLKVWLDTHEEEIMAMAHAEHSKAVVKNDNGGTDMLNKAERDAGYKDRKISAQQREIDRLKQALEVKKPDKTK